MSECILWDVSETPWPIEDKSVQCAVTSPPYWGLRDYGVEGQLGLEKTPAEYVERMVQVFREVKRVLRDDGTCWLNIGDSYAGQGAISQAQTDADIRYATVGNALHKAQRRVGTVPGLKPKDLCLIPFRLALALQDDGWYVRSDICWAKKAPMPESCKDRPTSAWEHVFLLTKSARYYYDAEAVKQPSNTVPHKDVSSYEPGSASSMKDGKHQAKTVGGVPFDHISGANLRNVWLLGPEPYPEAHFATFPTEIPRRAIKAGTSEKGCCSECGAPWERVVEPTEEYAKHLGKDWADYEADAREGRGHSVSSQRCTKRGAPSLTASYKTTGWRPTCECGADVVPCRVLDPFMGSGTTAMVAKMLERQWIGLELNPEYIALLPNRFEKIPKQLKMKLA